VRKRRPSTTSPTMTTSKFTTTKRTKRKRMTSSRPTIRTWWTKISMRRIITATTMTMMMMSKMPMRMAPKMDSNKILITVHKMPMSYRSISNSPPNLKYQTLPMARGGRRSLRGMIPTMWLI
jgi:hypothetical protein